MNRCVIYALSMIAVMLLSAACFEIPGTEPEPEPVEKPEITLQSDQKVALNPEGDDVAVQFYSSMSWTAGLSSVSNVEEWMSISKTSGGKGEFSISVVAQANGTGKRRTASLDITSEGITKSVVFTQESTQLEGDNATRNVSSEGGILELDIEYSGSYEVSIDVDWISHIDTKALQSAILVFEVDANDGEERSGKVVVSGSGKQIVVTVNQDKKENVEEEDVFKLLSNSATVPAEGGRVEVTVRTNVDYEYDILHDWVSEVSTKAVEEKVHVFVVEANPTAEERTATVTFCANTSCVPFMIIQEAGEPEEHYLTVDVSSLEIDADDVQSYVVNVDSNIEWTVKSNKSSWCKVSVSEGEGQGTFEITCKENTGDERKAVVTVSAGSLSCKINVTQKAAEEDPVEPEDPVEDPYLEVDTYGWAWMTSAAAEKEVEVVSNVNWTASSDVTWCTVSPSSGNGNGIIVVSVKENKTAQTREAVITVASGTITRQFVVSQPGTSGTEGFEEDDELDWDNK